MEDPKPAIPDPVCVMGRDAKGKPTACGGCHYCLKAKHGADYWTKGLTK